MEENNLNELEDNYLEVIAKNILNDVKWYVKEHNIVLEKTREVEIDKKMIDVIRSIILNEKVEFFYQIDDEDEEDVAKKIKDGIMPSLIQYYTALYFDNLDLLHELLDKEFSIGYYKKWNMALFVLDKRISSQFNQDEYINIVNNNREIFVNFYRSLYCNKKDINEEEIITEFCNIIKTNNKNNFKEKPNFLRLSNLCAFTEEEIYKLNGTQKENLSYYELDEKESKFKINLIKKYNYSKSIIYWNKFMEYFTEEEILSLSQEDISLYEYIMYYNLTIDNALECEKKAISCLKEIKKINPEFNFELYSITYDVLTMKQIMAMSEKCVKKIETLCSNYWLYNTNDSINIDFSEKLLRKLIKESYCKDAVKRNVKKIVKRK